MKLQSVRSYHSKPSRMNYLLTNNPTGELVNYLTRLYKVYKWKNR